jgi:hypothetical protein
MKSDNFAYEEKKLRHMWFLKLLWIYQPVLTWSFIYCRDECKSEPMIPWSSELKPVHSFIVVLFIVFNYYCHFVLLLFGISSVFIFIATPHKKFTIL